MDGSQEVLRRSGAFLTYGVSFPRFVFVGDPIHLIRVRVPGACWERMIASWPVCVGREDEDSIRSVLSFVVWTGCEGVQV